MQLTNLQKMSETSDVVLSYKDCLLRVSDVDLLRGPHWLNDIIIGFYFEYLEDNLSTSQRQDSLLISPELTQILKFTSRREYGIFLEPLDALSKSFIFFPLNNCKTPNSAGGSHWSLLVFSKPEKMFFHFDSSNGSNGFTAWQLANNLASYLLKKPKADCEDVDCPSQQNSYDCGLYVLCFADILLSHTSDYSKVKGCRCEKANDNVKVKRTDIINLIESLAKV